MFMYVSSIGRLIVESCQALTHLVSVVLCSFGDAKYNDFL